MAILRVNSGKSCSPPIRVKPLRGLGLVDATFLRRSREEFALILPNTASKGAEFIAEQMVQRIQQKQIAHTPSPVSAYVSISVGIAVTLNSTVSSSMALFEMADMALYRAKATGRNRFCLQTVSEEN